MVEGETVFVAAKLKEKAEEVKLIEYLECTVESQPYKNYITALRFKGYWVTTVFANKNVTTRAVMFSSSKPRVVLYKR